MEEIENNWKTYIYEFLEYLNNENKLSDNSINLHIYDMKNFGNFMITIGKSPNNITEIDIKEFIKYLNNKEFKITTIARCITSIKKFWQ